MMDESQKPSANPTPPPPLSMKEMQARVGKRLNLNGDPAEEPRLNQGRVGGEKQSLGPAPRKKKKNWIKWLPWIATGGATGGTLWFLS